MSDPALLELSNLYVGYGAVPALLDVSFSVRAGEVVGVVGPNGAGKSTMLAAIMRMVGWRHGDVRFRGQSLAKRSSDEVARMGIALVPEGRQIFADLTVHENLRLGMIARRSRDGASGDLANVIELFPVVGQFRDRPAGLLSGGQQQQLAIARALLADPELLVLDEPSLGLAPALIDALFSSLDAVRAAGRTIVIVEQRAQRAMAFADRTYVLAGGRIRAELGPDDAHNGELLRAAYFGSEDGPHHSGSAS